MTRKEQYADRSYSQETRRKIREMAAGMELPRVESPEGDCPIYAGPAVASLEAMVAWASERNDGWLRLVPRADLSHDWKWRFTSGKWAGHYVFFRQAIHETATEAWRGLARKVSAVDAGLLKPSKDVYN